MKKIILSAAVAFTVLTTTNVVAQQGFGTNTPDRSAAVDIVSSKRGLLIPRIAISDLDLAAPVANPANALMVYNTGAAGTAAGFYYWDATYNNNAGRWVRFVSSNSGSAVTVSAGNNVTVTPTSNGHDTDYNVSVTTGNGDGQVLVTKEVTVGGNTTYVTEWVNPQDFINGSVVGENGIKTNIKTVEGKEVVTVGLGGTLNTATTIETTVGVDGKPGNTLAITGLEKLDGSTGKEFNATTQNIVIMGADGILKVVTPEELLDKAIGGGEIDGKALTSSSIKVDANGATALLKDVNIEINPGGTDGMVLVTKVTTGTDGTRTSTTEWKAPSDLSNTLVAGQGVSIDADNKINLGGNPITSATVLNVEDANASLAIKGLEEKDKDGVAGNNVVLADSNGVLSETSPANLIGKAIEDGGIEAKTLTGDGITVTATDSTTGTTTAVVNSLLKDVTLGIADNAISTSKIVDGAVTNGKIDAGAVSQEKLYAGTIAADGTKTQADAGNIPVANADGTVTYKPLNTAVGAANLLTDGKIVIGNNASAVQLAAGVVLAETTLSIKAGSIGTTELTDGAVTAEKMTANVGAADAPKGSIPVAGENGSVTYQQVTGELLNGKALTSESIVVTGGAKALLDATKIEIKGGTAAGQVLVTEIVEVNGETVHSTKWVTPTDLGNTVTASNGLTKTGNDIALGGTIDKEAKLVIAPGTTNPDGTVTGGGSLVIDGLKTANPKQTNKTVVVQADGKLATIDTAAGEVNITEGDVFIGGTNSVVNNYHPSMSEIVIVVNLGATDTNLSLPAVNGTEGQTISVKIANLNENHAGYLNIKSGTEVLAYGAMPHQGWIIKSNGTKWIVVGRN